MEAALTHSLHALYLENIKQAAAFCHGDGSLYWGCEYKCAQVDDSTYYHVSTSLAGGHDDNEWVPWTDGTFDPDGWIH